MSMLDSYTARCALCDSETAFDEILSTSSVGSSDLGTRSPAMRWAIIQTLVQRCPGCGYCASDVSVVNPDAPAVINGREYQGQLHDPAYPELINSFLCKAILDRESKTFSNATWSLMQAAWFCDDADHVKLAQVCRNKAADMLMLAEEHNQKIAKQDGMSVAILVDLLRRSEQVDRARKLIEARRGGITDDLIKRILDYQNDLLDKNDFSRHTIAEAQSHLKKSAPGVTSQDAPNIIGMAQEEPEFVASSRTGLGSPTTPSALQEPQGSRGQVGAQPSGSIDDDAGNKHGKAGETPTSPMVLFGLKEYLKPLLFYLITVVIAVVGISLGHDRSPIDPPLSLLFAIPGAFATVFALLLTVSAVWSYAPVLIERSPAPARPLVAPIIIAIWASIPIWVYYLNHDPSFNFHRFLNYFEFHGLVVAKLFVVGIIASLLGHKHVTPRNKRIQPYILIPVISMFIGFWLSPDSDPALETIGLTAGLVYYIGVLVAALLGYFLGEVMRSNKSSQ